MPAPVRTCVGCRQRGDKTDLVRLVWRPGGVLVDLYQTQPGRGAYVHRNTRCADQAVRRKAVGRALRAPSLQAEQLAAVLGGVVS